MANSRPIICPECHSNCSRMFDTWYKCQWCRWQGNIMQTCEYVGEASPLDRLRRATKPSTLAMMQRLSEEEKIILMSILVDHIGELSSSNIAGIVGEYLNDR